MDQIIERVQNGVYNGPATWDIIREMKERQAVFSQAAAYAQHLENLYGASSSHAKSGIAVECETKMTGEMIDLIERATGCTVLRKLSGRGKSFKVHGLGAGPNKNLARAVNQLCFKEVLEPIEDQADLARLQAVFCRRAYDMDGDITLANLAYTKQTDGTPGDGYMAKCKSHGYGHKITHIAGRDYGMGEVGGTNKIEYSIIPQ